MGFRTLHVVTVVGLPLSGKTSFVRHVATSPRAAAFIRRTGHCGFAGIENGCITSLSSWGHDEDAMLLRTFGGSVWQDSAWTLAIADSDGLIVLIDPQMSRAPAQADFLARLVDRVRRTHFDPSDVLITASIGKLDLVNTAEVRAARESLQPMGWPTSTHNGLDGKGVHDAAGVLLGALVAGRRALPNSQDGAEALRQARWDPFKQ